MSYKNDRIIAIPAPLPTDYDRQYSFTDFQVNNPGKPLPGNEVDAELNAIEQALDETQDRLKLVQRDDGALQNKSVGLVQLKGEVDIGVNEPSNWAEFTNYEERDTVIFDNSAWYLCLESHTSSDDFTADKDSGKWKLLLDFTAFFTTEAEHWANYPEDDLVPEGDGVDDYSALHHSRKAEGFRNEAEIFRDDAEAAADSLNLPTLEAGDAGKRVQVSATEDGYIDVIDAAVLSGTNTLTASIGLDQYTSKQVFYFKAASTNTGSVTLNLDSLGAKDVTLSDGTALPAGSLEAGKVYSLWYDGSKFIVLNPSVSQAVAEAGTQGEGVMTPERTEQWYKAKYPPIPSGFVDAGDKVFYHENLTLDDTPIDVSSFGLAETVGPTGSGATNEWADLDDLPLEAKSVVLRAFISATSSGAGFTRVYLNAGYGTGATSSDTATVQGTLFEAAGSGEEQGVFTGDITVPVNENNVFVLGIASDNTSARVLNVFLSGYRV